MSFRLPLAARNPVSLVGIAMATAMALLFLGAPEHKISAGQLDALEKKFSRLTAETAQSVINLYRSRKAAAH